MSELVDMLPDWHIATVRVPCPWDHKGHVMRSLIAEQQRDQIELFEGLRVVATMAGCLFSPTHRIRRSASTPKRRATARRAAYAERMGTRIEQLSERMSNVHEGLSRVGELLCDDRLVVGGPHRFGLRGGHARCRPSEQPATARVPRSSRRPRSSLCYGISGLGNLCCAVAVAGVWPEPAIGLTGVFGVLLLATRDLSRLAHRERTARTSATGSGLSPYR